MIRDKKRVRWTVLMIVSFTMMVAYFFYDAMAPLKGMLERTQGWSSTDYGLFTSSYSWFNVFLLMLFLGGILLDRKGIRFTGGLATGLMVIGALIKYAALAGILPTEGTLFGVKNQVLYASAGFGIYGVGAEVAGVVVTRAIVKWFSGYELALAMGLQVSIARIGTGIAYLTANPLAEYFKNVPNLVMFGTVLLIIGMLAFLIYNVALDKKLDREQGNAETASPDDEFKFADVKLVFGNRGFWLLAILCVLFYSCVFPFLKYAPDLMTNKFGITENWSGAIPSVLPLGTVLLTPLFGSIYDKKGKGATIMIVGALMLVGIHALFSVPGINHWIYAICLTVLLGISFSLVPSAMWPAVTKIVPEKQLGTAYALIFWVQNIGLMGIPLLIGVALDRWCKIELPDGTSGYDYTLPMLVFTGIAVLSAIVAVLLKREDARKGYGLEEANMAV
ncbi:MAG: MFS transporter [Dysgonamonadaceae bacterium]|jgi:MFS family permease|nr:MFS transporter [Dysgonamonadaceae bacterium]